MCAEDYSHYTKVKGTSLRAIRVKRVEELIEVVDET